MDFYNEVLILLDCYSIILIQMDYFISDYQSIVFFQRGKMYEEDY